MIKKRCPWCNLKNPLYIDYHDHEWGILRTDDAYLFEMLLLESFQAGLSWECVLNKRAAFKAAFDDFDPIRISHYNEQDIARLMTDSGIIRNRLKINSAVQNARIFLDISKEHSGFYNYLLQFTGPQVMIEWDKTTNDRSDAISGDLRKRGMRFTGSTVIYSYLQAIGLINSHLPECDLFSGSK